MMLVILFANIIISTAVTADKSPIPKGEHGVYFEGDMMLTNAQLKAIYESIDNRNALRDVTKLWPNHTVVYSINKKHLGPQDVQLILSAMNHIEEHSCVKFQAKKSGEYAADIVREEKGCFSAVGYGRDDVRQVVNLDEGCMVIGTVVHELLHTLGFFHMQSTYDRDDYVKILWENIKPSFRHNFLKYDANTVIDFGVPYDYNSVMHYSSKAFSVDGHKRTIVPIKKNAEIGQRIRLSRGDITKLSRMYCQKNEETTPNYGHINKNHVFCNTFGFILCILVCLF